MRCRFALNGYCLMVAYLYLLFTSPALGQTSLDECMSCHGETDLTGEDIHGRQISVYVDGDLFEATVHGDFECVDCHSDLEDFDDFPHQETLETVDCAQCHDEVTVTFTQSVHRSVASCSSCHGKHDISSPSEIDAAVASSLCNSCHPQVAKEYGGSLHGEAVQEGKDLAPQCWDCHGGHDILPVHSMEARTYTLNIPLMCGSCHKEGTKVTQRFDIHEDSVLFHYSQSIHGAGLFNRGLIVTAICTSCHTAHNVRDYTDPLSSIHRENVSATCRQCHGLIEKTHSRWIQSERWQTEPENIPVCVDCHSPHLIKRVLYLEGISDVECLACHGNMDTFDANGNMNTEHYYLDTAEVRGSVHRATACAQCHTGATPGNDRPCSTLEAKVDCTICHSEVGSLFTTGMHGRLADEGDIDAPTCIDCHGTHNVLGAADSQSPIYSRNVPTLCARCHRKGEQAAVRITDNHERVEEYVMSIHGKGLLKSGLVVTAMCTDCHTAHQVLPHTDTLSSVHRSNIPHTCARCHDGIYETFKTSIHSTLITGSEKKLPTCNDCHSSHQITRADVPGFRLKIMNQCGDCHVDVIQSYFETFHGKVSKLGYEDAAQCYDCHGAHDILPPSDPASQLSRSNIVATCAKCHPGSHRQFAEYLTHATHHDRTKYPILFFTFWFMTVLLVGTLVVATAHTILWLPRSFQAMREHKKLRKMNYGRLEYRRFKPLHSWLHVMVVVSFLGLALTGMTLKFSYLGWAQWLSGMLGGFESAGYIHRVCALITFGYFGIHLVDLILNMRRSRKTLKQCLQSMNCMLPTMRDLREFIASLKWFVGSGPQPRYGRWTYWEKFDYFAVFWGVAIIGATGLLLWFPEFFTHFMPGWMINVATIVHSDEALLATAFIFTVHFFNTHARPDKFPMDTVIFSGRMTVEELKRERPREYKELIRSRSIKKHLVEPLPEVVMRAIRIFGATALAIGLALILLIIYAEILGYR